MNQGTFILMGLSVLTNGLLLFMVWDLNRELKFRKQDAEKWYRRSNELVTKLFNGRDPFIDPPEKVGADILQRMVDLETENAGLRSDIETGCRLIDEQKNMITGQRETVTRLVNENRRFLRGMKRK
jgi:hypothetical protein